MAPAVHTFIKNNNWNNKIVVPFSTHGGWPGHLLKDIAKGCKGATIKESKEIQFDSTGGARQVTSDNEVQAWINKVAQIKK